MREFILNLKKLFVSLDTNVLTSSDEIIIYKNSAGADKEMSKVTLGNLLNTIPLPSYVDDVLEYANFVSLPITGETGKIYVTLNDNKTYRWSGSIYIEIASGVSWGGITGTLSNQTDLQNEFITIWEVENFEPTIEIVFARGLVGNCKSAAVLGKWSLNQVGIKSFYINLYGKNQYPHRVCVTNNYDLIISNNNMINLCGCDLWRNEVLSWFGYKYNIIKVEINP